MLGPRAAFLVAGMIATAPALAQPLAVNLGGVNYYSVPQLANALAQSDGWLRYTTDFGTPADLASPQFDEHGFPRFLNPGEKLRAIVFGFDAEYSFRPPTWPRRNSLARGRFTLAWRGDADVRLSGCDFAPTSALGPVGRGVDGRRVYVCANGPAWIEVHEIATPIQALALFLPTPDDPATPADESQASSLEGRLFHPTFLARLADSDWAFLRFMDWNDTNASPQQDWADRRLPGHVFQGGILNRRSPGGGHDGDRPTGVAFEHMVALANATGRDLWINVPHLATGEFVRKLALLLLHGSDGREPYDAPRANPAHPPLRDDLAVHVEYSNEIWSSGPSFAQGDWAAERAEAAGISKARFNARRFCDVWRVFQEVFGASAQRRLVRVAATFTGLESYTEELLSEMAAYGPTLTPPVRPDILSPTTYLGNGIQDWVQEQGFVTGRRYDDPYWTSGAFATHLARAFAEWHRRILSGDSARGGGPDATGTGGGFSASLRDLPRRLLGYDLPLVSYEGGPSLYTDYLDRDASEGGVPTDDAVTIFVEAMNRRPEMEDVYRTHLEIAASKGLVTHGAFTDASLWGKFGQWGHLESLDQPPASSPKWRALLDWRKRAGRLRRAGDPLGSAPRFETPPELRPAVIGTPYEAEVRISGGDGARTIEVAGASLGAGLAVVPVPGDPARVRIAGTLRAQATSYALLRATDADGDAAWRIFTVPGVGGPGTLVQSDFHGPSPALARPAAQTYVLSGDVRFGGWDIGPGVHPHEGDDAFVFSVDGPGGDAGDETLAQALADGEYLEATIAPAAGSIDLRDAEVRFTIRGIGYHAPRIFAVFSSLTGFAEANALFVSPPLEKGDTEPHEYVLRLPPAAPWDAVSSPLRLRIYAAGEAFEGHRTSLTGFKLTRAVAAPPSHAQMVPIVLSAGGVGGAFFTTELALTNRGATPSTVRFDYTAALGGGTGSASTQLAAGRQLVVPDAIAYLRGLGVPLADSGNRGGTLRVTFTGGPAAVTARTTSAVPAGRAGLAYSGVSHGAALTGPAWIFGLRQDASDRSNLALLNAGEAADGDVVLRVSVRGADGSGPSVLPDVALAPGAFAQISGILAGLSLAAGYARVERVSGTAPFYTYGVVNDQATGDGSFVPPVADSPGAPPLGLTLPVLVDAGAFSSELVLAESQGLARTVDFRWVASGLTTADRTARFRVSLAPYEQRIIPDVVGFLRAQGVPGVVGSGLAGALFATEAGGDTRGLFLGARASAPGGGGRFGVFYPATSFGAASSSPVFLHGLQQDAETRTNVAFVNTGECGADTDVFRVDVYDGTTGALARSIDGIEVPAGGWLQVGAALSLWAPGVANAYLRVTRTSGSNPFLAYAVVNDGGAPGQRTGDGAFLAALPDE